MMTGDSIKKAFIFVVGAAIGSAVTYKLLKTKYEQIADDEIDSMKKFYEEKDNARREYYEEIKKELDDLKIAMDEPVEKEEPEVNKDLVDYSKLATKYSSDSEAKPDLKKLVKTGDEPYVISPDEFGENDDYERIDLTLYEDGFLADDCDELVDDVEDIIGWENLDHMGEYEPDILHIQNDRTKTYYEICRDLRKYKDVVSE